MSRPARLATATVNLVLIGLFTSTWTGQTSGVSLVLETELLDHLRIDHDLHVHINRKRFRVRLGIVDGDLKVERAEVRPGDSFGHRCRIGERIAGRVQPLAFTET